MLSSNRCGWSSTTAAPDGSGESEVSAFHPVAAEAADGMVVDDADRLQPGIDDGRPDELEAAALQLLGDALGERRGGDPALPVALHHLAIGEGPAEIGEALALLRHRAIDPGAGDRRLDLGPGAHDA